MKEMVKMPYKDWLEIYKNDIKGKKKPTLKRPKGGAK